ncbi:hypothetical protein BDW69DRAFT_37982 [Aspergillus filifer]
MGFLGELIEGVIESKLSGSSHSQQQPEYGYEGGNSGYGSAPPPSGPQAPYPWVSRWDDRSQRWYFLNEQTGQTSWETPGGAPSYGGGYGGSYESRGGYGGGGGYGGPAPGYGGDSGYARQEGYYEQQQQPEKKDHTGLYVAGGVAAGAVGGALLMHEGEEIHDDFERDKYELEQGVEDLPEDAARWTGEAVGEVEQVPDRIEDGFDALGNKIEDAVDDVEDFPEDAAEWTGEKVGEVEQFGDNMEDAYDQGEYEGRNDDW